MRHHALRKQRSKRLSEIQLTDFLQRPRPESRIKQMQDRVLNPADILRNGQPRLHLIGIKRLVAWLRCKADEIPARIGESIQRVGLAPRRFLTVRAFDMLPCRMPVERITGHVETDILWQDNRQL